MQNAKCKFSGALLTSGVTKSQRLKHQRGFEDLRSPPKGDIKSSASDERQ
jgi:hypothetical protein